jgi:hypothetical protein
MCEFEPPQGAIEPVGQIAFEMPRDLPIERNMALPGERAHPWQWV